MSLPDPNTLVYAGIGSRQTPAATLNDMTTMSSWLARNAWHLSSGGAGRRRHSLRQRHARPSAQHLPALERLQQALRPRLHHAQPRPARRLH